MRQLPSNLTGLQVGYWSILRLAPLHIGQDGQVRTMWLCRCRCGKERAVLAASLISGHSTSCGCKAIEYTIDRCTKHGLRGTPEYRSWQSMRNRCNNPNHKNWDRYGGRGITLDPIFDDFLEFYAEVGKRPDGTSLDRINNDLGYIPGNIKWSTQVEQVNNSTRIRNITFNGKTQSVTAWSRELGIPRPTLSDRINNGGMTAEEALAIGWRNRSVAQKQKQSHTKLSKEQVLYIHTSQESARLVSEKIGTTKSHIEAIRSGRIKAASRVSVGLSDKSIGDLKCA